MSNYPLQIVSASELRRMFNEGLYYERAKSGEFKQIIIANRHPSRPRAQEPRCTRSQIIAYRDSDGNKIAIVHQYRRKDGTLGASGKPDPKTLLIDGILYRVVEP